MKSKTIGILGLGSQSTLFYMEELNAVYNKKHRGFSTCPFKMLNTNFDKINQLLPNPSKELETIVNQILDDLIQLEIDVILVPNITLFETIDKLKIATSIVHPVKATLAEIVKSKHKRVIIFGSQYTMESNYIKSIFAEKDLETFPPTQDEIFFIDNLRKQVYQKLATTEMLDEFNKIIEKYAKDFAVVTACTELSIALSGHNKNVFDMARIQIQGALDWIS